MASHRSPMHVQVWHSGHEAAHCCSLQLATEPPEPPPPVSTTIPPVPLALPLPATPPPLAVADITPPAPLPPLAPVAPLATAPPAPPLPRVRSERSVPIEHATAATTQRSAALASRSIPPRLLGERITIDVRNYHGRAR